jgi:hypothetical protein
VRDPDGGVWGTLCGSNGGALDVSPSLVVLFELFATLITQHVFGLASAELPEATSEERLTPSFA